MLIHVDTFKTLIFHRYTQNYQNKLSPYIKPAYGIHCLKYLVSNGQSDNNDNKSTN